jgi:hypothetical protein
MTGTGSARGSSVEGGNGGGKRRELGAWDDGGSVESGGGELEPAPVATVTARNDASGAMLGEGAGAGAGAIGATSGSRARFFGRSSRVGVSLMSSAATVTRDSLGSRRCIGARAGSMG